MRDPGSTFATPTLLTSESTSIIVNDSTVPDLVALGRWVCCTDRWRSAEDGIAKARTDPTLAPLPQAGRLATYFEGERSHRPVELDVCRKEPSTAISTRKASAENRNPPNDPAGLLERFRSSTNKTL